MKINKNIVFLNIAGDNLVVIRLPNQVNIAMTGINLTAKNINSQGRTPFMENPIVFARLLHRIMTEVVDTNARDSSLRCIAENAWNTPPALMALNKPPRKAPTYAGCFPSKNEAGNRDVKKFMQLTWNKLLREYIMPTIPISSFNPLTGRYGTAITPATTPTVAIATRMPRVLESVHLFQWQMTVKVSMTSRSGTVNASALKGSKIKLNAGSRNKPAPTPAPPLMMAAIAVLPTRIQNSKAVMATPPYEEALLLRVKVIRTGNRLFLEGFVPGLHPPESHLRGRRHDVGH